MTYKQNVTAILECNFAGFKQEIIDSAVDCIMALSENKGEWILYYRECGVEFYGCSKYKLGRAVIDGSFYKSLDEFKKCPICGASMRGET